MRKINMFIAVLSFFSISAMAEPYAFPVPFVPSRGDHQVITFRDLPTTGTIEIFTVNGEDVVTLDIPLGTGKKDWDAKNSSGENVASGVYIYLIEGGGQTTDGKLVIVR